MIALGKVKKINVVLVSFENKCVHVGNENFLSVDKHRFSIERQGM